MTYRRDETSCERNAIQTLHSCLTDHASTRALRQAEQIVGLLAISFRFQILVAVSADRDDDTYRVAAAMHVKRPLATFDARNGLGLAKAPASTVRIDTADAKDPLMRVVAVALVDAFDLIAHIPCSCRCHAWPPLARLKQLATNQSHRLRQWIGMISTIAMA